MRLISNTYDPKATFIIVIVYINKFICNGCAQPELADVHANCIEKEGVYVFYSPQDSDA